MRKVLRLGLTAAVMTTLAVAPPGPVHAAETMPIVDTEDYAYPGAAAVQQEFGITVSRGDGNIRIVARHAVDDDEQCRADQIQVEQLLAEPPYGYYYCFDVKATTGYVTLRIGGTFGVRAGGQALVATAALPDGTNKDYAVDPGLGVAINPGDGNTLPANTLLELRLSGAAAPPVSAPSSYPFVAKVRIPSGSSNYGFRECSGTLVDAYWVLTAYDCVHYVSTDPPRPGPPPPTQVILNRANVDGTGGFETTVSQTVSNGTLRLALLRLAAPATGVVPAVLTSQAPQVGEELVATGYGRTATEWVSRQLNTGAYTVSSIDTDTMIMNRASDNPVSTCKGDLGGPTLRSTGGTSQVVGVHFRSWMSGCVGSTATGSDVTEVRVDTAAAWIRGVISPIALRARINAKYVTMGGSTTAPLIANRTAVDIWEKFDQIDVGGGYVALYSRHVKRYVSSPVAGGTSPLVASATTIGAWEKFKVITNSDGTTSLLANANGNYVSADSAGAKPLIANRTAIGAWEVFDRVTSTY
ncbi:trypsin-like serine protease [Micromonospora sp. AKA38]|uniref:trypsin-like serine protease n=1 Tax=Micromonospora sp. AKA38 TaxID=2733861 RepID=UPI0022BDF383|nr:trypsin-like serine protease [Micromonospora sp. AKA38]GHJ12325.1 hypothetical protein TPA0908_03200 [Micromonospora sp. AKA38]